MPTGLSHPVMVKGPHRALALLSRREPGDLSVTKAHRLLRRLASPKAQVEGVDWHLAERIRVGDIARARAFVLLAPPIGNLDNPYYRVHPRRNDRITDTHPQLHDLYPDLDLTGVAHTGSLLSTLALCSPERYDQLHQALKAQWAHRMQVLLQVLPQRGVLVELAPVPWMARPRIPAMGYHHRYINVDLADLWAGAKELSHALRVIRAS